MSNLAFLPSHHPALPLPASPGAGADIPGNAFWCEAMGAAVTLAAGLAAPLDELSQHIARLPVRAAVTRPVVGQYLCMLRTLAAAWQSHSRPALLAAVEALALGGGSMAQPHSAAALQRSPDGACAGAARLADCLQRRLAAPIAAFEALDRDFSSYLSQMARASGELECDTALVTHRVQADFVHAFLLSQQASALQSKLDDAELRQHDTWLLGPHAEQVRQEITRHRSALEGVRRQLTHLRAEQAATQGEADYLQSLLPSLATYLATVERMGAALAATLHGARTLRAGLSRLEQALAAGQAGDASDQLGAALPRWEALAAAAVSLRADRP